MIGHFVPSIGYGFFRRSAANRFWLTVAYFVAPEGKVTSSPFLEDRRKFERVSSPNEIPGLLRLLKSCATNIGALLSHPTRSWAKGVTLTRDMEIHHAEAFIRGAGGACAQRCASFGRGDSQR